MKEGTMGVSSWLLAIPTPPCPPPPLLQASCHLDLCNH